MSLKKIKEVSLRKGILVEFNVENKSVMYWASAISGREKVTVDNVVVSESKNYKTRTVHFFSVGSNEYSIEIKNQNALKGNMKIVLLQSGTFLKGYNMTWESSPVPKKPPLYVYIIPGLLLGFGLSYFDFRLADIKSSWMYWVAAFIVLFFVSFIYIMSRGNWTFREIEK